MKMLDLSKTKAMAEALRATKDDKDLCFHSFVAEHNGNNWNKGLMMDWFTIIQHCIPDKFFYENYKGILSDTPLDWYMECFDISVLKRVFELNKHDTIENPELISLLDEEGYLTVYHGHCTKTLHKNNSWTIDPEIAKWFGQRNAFIAKYRSNPILESIDYFVVTGKVHITDVIAYITDRSEAEIVVLSKNVKNKKKEFFAFTGEEDRPKRFKDNQDQMGA